MKKPSQNALSLLFFVAISVLLVFFLYFIVIAGFGHVGALISALIVAGVVAAGIYLFLMTTLGKEWTAEASAKLGEKLEEAKTAIEEKTSSAANPAEATGVPEAASAVPPAPEPEPMPDPMPEPTPEPTPEAVPTGGGGKPAMLSAPEGGQADDLKKIKGVGPKLEQALNDMGVYHYSQIAAWSAAEVAWVDENLVSFKGRASRDDWVGQAKVLANG